MPTFLREQDGSLSEQTRKAIVEQLYEYVEEYSIETYPAEHRNHLGVSVIGEKCSRKLWYIFRWVKLEQFSGRMRRLFNRGHKEEEKFKELLSWMGFFVRTIDPNTDRQYRFSDIGGHYGGSGDSIVLLPWFRDDESFRILAEYKTHKDKLFQKLKTEGVKISNYKHWVQMCGYGKAFNVKYGLYCAVNKDDDDIHFELLELDWQLAQQMENKASDIITSQIPPQKISLEPSYFDCKYCHFNGICHYNEPVERNCRSCKFAVPIEGAQWKCTRFDTVIPKNKIGKEWGCHVSINT